jgi:hypothetical protein
MLSEGPPTRAGMPEDPSPTPIHLIGRKVLFIRGQWVILDADLAEVHGVETNSLARRVSRNPAHFPSDFVFRLTENEFEELKRRARDSRWSRRRKPPLAFTEQGVAMMFGVLRSRHALAANVEVTRTFVRMREFDALLAGFAT